MTNFRAVQAKMAGRFNLVSKEPDKIIVRCIGSLVDQKITQEDVDYICGFHNIKPTEKWLREETKNHGFNLIIYKEEAWQ